MPEMFGNLEKPTELLNAETFGANLQGEITADQRAWLGAAAGWKHIVFLGSITVILGGFVGLVLFPIILGGIWYELISSIFIMAIIFIVVLFNTGRASWKQMKKALKLKRDMDHQAIRLGQGQLLDAGKGYAFDLGDSQLHLPANQPCGLLPGILYQVCYLDESQFVISAVSVAGPLPAPSAATDIKVPVQAAVDAADPPPGPKVMEPKHHPPHPKEKNELNEILAFANGFTEADLLANKKGKVTPSQLGKLQSKTVLAGMVLIFFPVLAICLVSVQDIRYNAFPVLLIFAVAVSIGVSAFFIVNKDARADLKAPKPRHIDGAGNKTIVRVSGGRTSRDAYCYVIRGERFEVSRNAYDALVTGRSYRIYYLPNTRQFLSIEVLD